MRGRDGSARCHNIQLPLQRYHPSILGHRRCFFFQAEDGIRYDLVTGVQTCALPILDGLVDHEQNLFDDLFGYLLNDLLNHPLISALKADRISEATSRKVSEARLVRALIMLSQDISDEKIIKALKEVW